MYKLRNSEREQSSLARGFQCWYKVGTRGIGDQWWEPESRACEGAHLTPGLSADVFLKSFWFFVPGFVPSATRGQHQAPQKLGAL